MKIDTQAEGFAVAFKDYQEEVIKHLWSIAPEGASSRYCWEAANEGLKPKTISRASVINFCNAMVVEGVFDYTEITGKGGTRRIYTATMNGKELIQYLSKEVTKALDSFTDSLTEGSK